MDQMEPSPPKKLWNILRIVFFMLRKGISKSKLMLDLNLLLKRGNKIAEKAIGELMFLHHAHNYSVSSFSCRPNPNDNHLSYFSPREYEFSCSNTPVNNYLPHSYLNKRKHHNHHYRHRHHHHHQYDSHDRDTMNAVQKVLEMLNNNDPKIETTTTTTAASSPFVNLPGFGRSPMGRQLRITDSPFPIKDAEEDTTQVDKAAEEFIKKFYKELKKQKKKSAIESPYHDMWCS